MESSTLVKYEYFELVKKLNQANKLKNQETDIYFYIDSVNSNHVKLFVAVASSQKILLSEKINGGPWLEAGFSEYPNLEDCLTRLLRINDHHDNLTKYFKSHIFKLPS